MLLKIFFKDTRNSLTPNCPTHLIWTKSYTVSICAWFLKCQFGTIWDKKLSLFRNRFFFEFELEKKSSDTWYFKNQVEIDRGFVCVLDWRFIKKTARNHMKMPDTFIFLSVFVYDFVYRVLQQGGFTSRFLKRPQGMND